MTVTIHEAGKGYAARIGPAWRGVLCLRHPACLAGRATL